MSYFVKGELKKLYNSGKSRDEIENYKKVVKEENDKFNEQQGLV
jgi:hypothetical protein